jgi:Helitron helicase-like domain at N-terminus
MVDIWLSIEMHKLEYYYFNQKKIRAHLYDTARSQLLGEQNVSQTGRRVVLPANFPGGTRNVQRSYQDSMAIVRTFGKPAYLITFTANPNWDEIQASYSLMTKEFECRVGATAPTWLLEYSK